MLPRLLLPGEIQRKLAGLTGELEEERLCSLSMDLALTDAHVFLGDSTDRWLVSRERESLMGGRRWPVGFAPPATVLFTQSVIDLCIVFLSRRL
jgi:hypothetical protein